ncbi:substrate-binding domain-containing protein [Marinagarivorans cellulosilyticus]|uniref:Phosphate transport system substrate-binding protein n=1 Tax=Marinagarivorans cellulosilyticus TaxID=2721545 RepID=A0AAN1WGQ2_9GAMM|nr:phosphate transport system substrate-binding protein [Marinagarivorans cellulosilyticus]
MKKLLMAAACVASFSLAPQAFANRDHIMVVGSSTVFPFSKVVAERFGRKTNFKAPKIEPTGTGGGFKEFCKGVGISTPDVSNASRRIKSSEFEDCQKNGVKDIVEVLIGYDGIVIANSVKAKPMTLELKDIFLALAKKVPDPKGTETLVDNPYVTWKDVNPALPATKIEVLGPPPTSGTRDAFVELAMEGGCKTFPWIKAMKGTDKSKYKALCHGIREDGAYVEAGENDNLIVRKLSESPKALGIFGFSFLDQNADKVHAAKVGGHAPTFESISDGSYIVSRPLYFYVKAAHVGVIPGIQEFLAEFTNDRAWGDEGYLTDKGLIPLSAKERAKVGASVKKLESLSL